MKILLASDSFKGSASAREICDAMDRGIKRVDESIEVVKLPLADGGEGTLETVIHVLNGKIIEKEVTGPLGEKVKASFGIANNVAIIEMAYASGLLLVQEKDRNPLVTTTYGTGELIKEAIAQGCTKIVIGIGGSATNDGGAGMAQALGYQLKDINGKEISFGGENLKNITTIDTTNVDKGLNEVEFIVACDVSNVLCGPKGASFVYGRQKGASDEDILILDDSLNHFAKKIMTEMTKDVALIPGSGAAGGLGAGLIAFCDARLEKGIEIILDIINVDEYLKGVDLVITGEGQIDGQSIYGKTPIGIANHAAKYNIPTIAIAGGIGDGIDDIYLHNIESVMTIVSGPMSLDTSKEQVIVLMESATERAIRLLNVGTKIGAKSKR